MSLDEVVQGLKQAQELVKRACLKRPEHLESIKPRLVAVSKTKPVEHIIAAYNVGQRHFGENYVQELIEKAFDQQVLDECKEIKWHFIGNLQKNKISKIISIPGLYVIETVDSEKLATALNKAWGQNNHDHRLKMFIQVNTSQENEKNGIKASDVVSLTDYILNNCPNLEFSGLMTIGKFGHNLADGPNADFQRLIKCKEIVCKTCNLQPKYVELSMGMSDDFEHAIEVGSTNVRIGSLIFGYRPKQGKFGNLNINQVTDQLGKTDIN